MVWKWIADYKNAYDVGKAEKPIFKKHVEFFSEDKNKVFLLETENEDENLPTAAAAIDTSITLDDFIGQESAKEMVNLFIQAWANDPKYVPPHMLFTGPGGTGKSTIAFAIANSVGRKCITTTPQMLRKPSEIFEFFFNDDMSPKTEQGDIIFIDEVHGFDKRMASYIYNVIQDFCFDYKPGRFGKPVRLRIPQFLCIAATTDSGLMHPPLRTRFSTNIQFEDYKVEELQKIASMSRDMTSEASYEIAKRSAGNPRRAKAIAELAYVKALSQSSKSINVEDVQEICRINDIDERGLDRNCQRVVKYFIKTGNKVAGTNPVSASTQVYKTTLDGETFPAMSHIGVLIYTARGKQLDPSYYQEVIND